MKSNLGLITFVSLVFLVAGTGLLSACSSSVSDNTASQLASRISTLESDVQTNGVAIAALQQQMQSVQQKVDALAPTSPSTAPPTTPSTSAPPTAPPSSITPSTPPTPSSSLRSDLINWGNLTVSPAQVSPGGVVSISVDVTNNSTVGGSYQVVMVENLVPQVTSDVLEFTNLITLKPGETQKVTFTTSTNVTGTYSVKVGNQAGGYTVIAPPPPPAPSE